MYRLRLCKAKSYRGIVVATEKVPVVAVPEKEQAEKLIASGYFILLDADEKQVVTTGGDAEVFEADEAAEAVSFDESDTGEDGTGMPIIIELQSMTKVQLSEYADKNGIDITGCKTKDDIFQKIVEAVARADAARAAIRNGE